MVKVALVLLVTILASGSCEDCGRQIDEAISDVKTGVVELQTELATTPTPEGAFVPGVYLDRVREVEGQTPFLGFFAVPAAGGTAWYVDDDRLLTAHHVVDGEEPLLLERFGGSDLFRLKISRQEKALDIALLEPADEAEEAEYVFSLAPEPPVVGQVAWGICASPAEDGRYVSLTVTATSQTRSYNDYTIKGAVEYAGEAHAGCSGGPILNTRGEVIGMMLAAGSGTTVSSSAASIAEWVN